MLVLKMMLHRSRFRVLGKHFLEYHQFKSIEKQSINTAVRRLSSFSSSGIVSIFNVLQNSGSCGSVLVTNDWAVLHQTGIHRNFSASNSPQRKVLEAKDSTSIKDILLLSENIHEIHPADIVEMWSTMHRSVLKTMTMRISKLQGNEARQKEISRRKTKISFILEHTFQCLDLLNHKEITDITFAIGGIFQHIKKRMGERSSVNHQTFCEVLLDGESNLNRELLLPFAESLRDSLPLFDLRDLSHLSGAYAMMRYDPVFEDGKTLFHDISTETMKYVDEFDPESISNILRSYATLKVSNPSLFQSFGDAIVEKADLDTFAYKHMSDLVWAYATNKEHHPELFQKIGDSIASRDIELKGLRPPEPSEILWSFATMNEKHPAMFQKIGDSINTEKGPKLAAFKPRDLVNTLWAFAKSGESHPTFLTEVSDAILNLDDWSMLTSEEVENLVWACETNKSDGLSLDDDSKRRLLLKIGEFLSTRDVEI